MNNSRVPPFHFKFHITWARYIMAKTRKESRTHIDSSLVVVEVPFHQPTPDRWWLSTTLD